MVEFTLHAGLHKTATTSLQEHVFPNVKHAFYTGKSRHVMMASTRFHYKSTREAHKQMFRMLQALGPKPWRIPLHSCCYLLALLQDYLVSTLARHYASVEQLEDLFTYNAVLLKTIQNKCENPHVFYSCEGLLLTIGHLKPDEPGRKNQLPPLAHHQLLFPGQLKRVVVYLRSPVDYLFSRYIQIHDVRFINASANSGDSLISIERYLDLNEQLWRGEAPQQSVFYHIFQPQLITELRSLGLPLQIRSYDKHIRGNESISKEVATAFDLQVYNPARVDNAFQNKPLNTTSENKDSALNQLLAASGHKDRASLRHHFTEIATAHPLIQEAMATTVFPDN